MEGWLSGWRCQFAKLLYNYYIVGSNPIPSELTFFSCTLFSSLLGGMVDTIDLKSILIKVSVQVR